MPVEVDPVLWARGLEKSFGSRFGARRSVALRGVDFAITAGEAVALVGVNGAGKTTLLRMVVGSSRPSEGELRLFGRSPAERSARARIGYMPQAFRVHGFLTARKGLAMLGLLAGVPKAGLEAAVRRELDRVGLSGAIDRRLSTFSGGMMRRLALAQALIHRPELLVLDEPSSGLDPPGRRMLTTVLNEERMRGATILLSTHIIADVERCCGRVLLLSETSIRLDAEISRLTAPPEKPDRAPTAHADLESILLTHLQDSPDST